jgi:hypothetical protein
MKQFFQGMKFLKKGMKTKKTAHLKSMRDELRHHWSDVSEGCERSDGCAWALVLVGEIVTKTCCGGACTHDCDPQDADSDVSSQTWCTRKNWYFVCVPELAVQACNTDTRRDHA